MTMWEDWTTCVLSVVLVKFPFFRYVYGRTFAYAYALLFCGTQISGSTSYLFKRSKGWGVFSYKNTEIWPFQVMHGRLPILGYRIGGRLGYVTDMLTMPDASYELLKGIDVLVMNALRVEPHGTHQCISQALEAAARIGARETYFIHMSHHAGLHAEISRHLPPHVHFAYDGLKIKF